MPRNLEKVLENIYYNPRSPASFSTAERLYREAKKEIPKLQRWHVQDYLDSQRTYTLHRHGVERYKRLKTVPSGLHTDWQSDLMDMRNVSKHNRGYRYILICIDVLSRMVYARAIKRKTSEFIIPAMNEIFNEANAIPRRLFTDSGKEFTSKAMEKFYNTNEIIKLQAYTHDVLHATMAERTIKTLRDILAKYFMENSTRKWTIVLQDVIHALNHRIHSTTKMRPVDVTYDNAEELRKRLYASNDKTQKPRFKVGDYVRISIRKKLFTKGQNRYTDEIFKITEVLPKRNPIVYRIQDLKGEPILGYFYERNMVRVQLKEKLPDDL